jgi:hypothetical protein
VNDFWLFGSSIPDLGWLDSWKPLPQKTDAIFQFLQLPIEHAAIFLIDRVFDGPADSPRVELKTLDLGNDIRFWIVDGAHREPPCKRLEFDFKS